MSLEARNREYFFVESSAGEVFIRLNIFELSNLLVKQNSTETKMLFRPR